MKWNCLWALCSFKGWSIHEAKVARLFFYTNISRQFASSSTVEGSKINLLLPSLFACLKLVNFKDEKWWWVGNSSWKSVNLAKRRNTTPGWAFDHRRHQRDVFQPRQFCSFAILPSAQMAKVQFLTYTYIGNWQKSGYIFFLRFSKCFIGLPRFPQGFMKSYRHKVPRVFGHVLIIFVVFSSSYGLKCLQSFCFRVWFNLYLEMCTKVKLNIKCDCIKIPTFFLEYLFQNFIKIS